jgi:hypothetical protein
MLVMLVVQSDLKSTFAEHVKDVSDVSGPERSEKYFCGMC